MVPGMILDPQEVRSILADWRGGEVLAPYPGVEPATVASLICATMCYMGNTEGKVQRVGVRELRQNLSRYLRLVAEGERFEVTEHNLPVAVLGPLPGHSSPLARLIAEGRIVPARLDLTELGPPPEQPREMTISEALAAQREER